MKKFFGEFKTFIMRGNVLDMSVGVIVGGAFTGIVNGLTNNILKPLINWVLSLILGSDGLDLRRFMPSNSAGLFGKRWMKVPMSTVCCRWRKVIFWTRWQQEKMCWL